MSELSGEYPDNAQRYAICVASWEEKFTNVAKQLSQAKFQEHFDMFEDISKLNFKSYNDYPESASNNACKVLRWREEHGDEVQGMLQVGWTRANQLCKRENISEETIARMASFARHKQNSEVSAEFKDTPWKDKGYVAWLGWGGTSGIEWAQNKLKSIRK